MKKQRFQPNRRPSRGRRGPEGRWVAEPLDIALAATALLIGLWLQLLPL